LIQQSNHRSALDRIHRQVGSPGLAAFLALFIFAGLLTAELLPRVSGRTLDPKRQSTQLPRDAGNGAGDEKDIRALEPGRPVKRELAGGEQHGYQVELNSGQFLKVTVEQQGIDVAVQVLGSDGKQIFEFDSESRLQGQEEVSLVAEAAGECRLMIRPKQKGAVAGSYEIRIEELRAATENDRALDEARKLYKKAGDLRNAGKYDESLPYFEGALEIREKRLGPDHPDVCQAINGLAIVHYFKGEYSKAEPLHQRALAIREKSLGPEHPDVALSLNNLAALYSNLATM
jgi:tetratricopeptide (TPR) repeat protein